MDAQDFSSFLSSLPITETQDGWSEAPPEHHITLHVGHDGVPLTVSKVEAVKLDGPILRARTRKGETYHVYLADIFAVAVEAPKASERKAGFAASR
jgi:hypothetical protein